MSKSRASCSERPASRVSAGRFLVGAGLALTVLAVPMSSCMLRRPLPIDEAVSCRVKGAPERSTGDMHLVRVADSTARCNDGTPPTMYVREASNPEHANDWVIQVQGGGNCSRSGQCQERWCQNDKLMSSGSLPGQKQGGGILADNRRNPFGDWNAVYLNYCTSDDWLGGSREQVVLDGMLSAVKMPFSGHLVLQELLSALDAGAAADGVRMPKLTNAERILWTGFSAGADGAAYNLDYAAGRYPRAKVIGLIDSYLQPKPEYFPGANQRLAGDFASEWETVHTTLWHRFGPPACSGGKCQDGTFLWTDVIKTPAVVHFDLSDPKVSQLYTTRDVQMSAFSVAAEKTLRDLSDSRANLSVIGSNCGRHVVTTNEALFDLTVSDTANGANDVTLLDAADRLMRGQGKVVAIDSVDGRTSRCPAKTIPDGDSPPGGRPTNDREQGARTQEPAGRGAKQPEPAGRGAHQDEDGKRGKRH